MSRSSNIHNFVSDPDVIASFLSSLIDGFKNRHLVIKFDDHEVTLKPGEVLDLSLETSKRKGRVKLSIDIHWPDQDHREMPSLLRPHSADK
ncbi:MAG: amphi-Trp domain-containing protein [Deltaproteobacteria bacterium]|jgi:amphi-Trp domain-containing protein|nr:amphi-Trp domain-containing protein [Deltaproteobacteria bacterium]